MVLSDLGQAPQNAPISENPDVEKQSTHDQLGLNSCTQNAPRPWATLTFEWSIWGARVKSQWVMCTLCQLVRVGVGGTDVGGIFGVRDHVNFGTPCSMNKSHSEFLTGR